MTLQQESCCFVCSQAWQAWAEPVRLFPLCSKLQVESAAGRAGCSTAALWMSSNLLRLMPCLSAQAPHFPSPCAIEASMTICIACEAGRFPNVPSHFHVRGSAYDRQKCSSAQRVPTSRAVERPLVICDGDGAMGAATGEVGQVAGLKLSRSRSHVKEQSP